MLAGLVMEHLLVIAAWTRVSYSYKTIHEVSWL